MIQVSLGFTAPQKSNIRIEMRERNNRIRAWIWKLRIHRRSGCNSTSSVNLKKERTRFDGEDICEDLQNRDLNRTNR